MCVCFKVSNEMKITVLNITCYKLVTYQIIRKSQVRTLLGTLSRLGMSVTTQGGSGRQYVTGSRRNISKYRFVLLNVYRFRET